MNADLHIHTSFSDGVLDPVRLVHEAYIARLHEIAITDHDTVDGLLALKKAGLLDAACQGQNPSKPVIIPGIEINADFPGYEVHILGYFIDIENTKLRTGLKILVENRRKRLSLMIKKINSLGYVLKYADVIEIASNSAAIGRPHVARALLQTGYFKNIKHVFDTILGKGSPAYVPQYRLPLEKVIEMIKDAGGIAVLAHPGLIGNDNIIQKIINKPGISGLEVYHPTHNQEQVKKFFALAQEHNLKITGGSDFHGIAGRFPEKLGVFYISTELADKLRQCII
jgi:predicted metal-dependent phosphoesterase TrpH